MVSVELNHQHTGICQREKVAFSKTQLPHLIQALKSKVGSVFVLSTCNRFSIYSSIEAPQDLIGFFTAHGVESSLVSVTNGAEQSAQKLFETASGLHSQFYGERQILSQIKEYYQVARDNHSLDKTLDLMVRSAIHAGKEVQKQTGLYRLNDSLAHATYELVEQHIAEIRNERVAIFGTGSMAKLVINKLTGKGLHEVFVVGRDEKRLKNIEERYHVKTINHQEFSAQAKTFDVFIGATDQKIDMASLVEHVGQRHIQMIDLGVPRNFDPKLSELNEISLVDLDHLQSCIKADTSFNLEMERAQSIIISEVQRFLVALNRLSISSYAGAYMRKMQQSSDEEFQWLMPRLKNLDGPELDLIKKYSHKLLRTLSRDVMEYINGLAYSGENLREAEMLKRLFKLEVETIHPI